MTDKGGKGSAKGGKSTLRSTSGKDDSSAKSKKGRKVQFDSGGGKGDKVANGTTKPAPKAPSPPEQRLDQEIPPNSRCRTDSEAAEILQRIQEQMVLLSRDPDLKLPVSFDTGLAYAIRGDSNVKPQTVKKILEPLKKHGVSDCEICLIANISPESVDEVFALVPALKPKMSQIREPLRIALDEIANLKQALANLRRST